MKRRLACVMLVAGGSACTPDAVEGSKADPTEAPAAELKEQTAVRERGAGTGSSMSDNVVSLARLKVGQQSFEGGAVEGRVIVAAADGSVEWSRREKDVPQASTRVWFPETFLFAPHVVTDAEGRASVEVTVPDRLTTWRVLALAHAREGAQAATLARFEGTLPVDVDVGVPSFAHVGDVFEVPLTVVNTTATRVRTSLALDLKGGRIVRWPSAFRRVDLSAGRTEVRYARIRATALGEMVLEARLVGQDAVRRTIPVRPIGAPRQASHSGTLGRDRAFELTLPENVDPATAKLRLSVFSGGLAVLRAELASVLARDDASSVAYALLLAGRGPGLTERLRGRVDTAAFRRLRLQATQRAIRVARTPSLEVATPLAEAALAHPGDPLLERLGLRLARRVAEQQRRDGMFSSETEWTVQRLLVATAEGRRAVRSAHTHPAARRWIRAATVRVDRAFERFFGRIQDAYTAAVVAASGGVSGPMLEALRGRVKAALETRPDGSRVLPVPEGAVRPDGGVPSLMEATGYATAALAREDPVRSDLAAALVAGYRPATGWGDGRTSRVALFAVLDVFRAPRPEAVEVDVRLDDRPVLNRRLEGAQLLDVATHAIPAPDVRGRHAYTVRANPPVPGWGYRVAVEYRVPWSSAASDAGLGVVLEGGKGARIGRPVQVVVRPTAPPKIPLVVYHALPAGVVPIRESLERLVRDRVVARFETLDGKVRFEVSPRTTAEPVAIAYRVVPELVGRLRSAVSSIETRVGPARRRYAPPAAWTVGW